MLHEDNLVPLSHINTNYFSCHPMFQDSLHLPRESSKSITLQKLPPKFIWAGPKIKIIAIPYFVSENEN